jgi:patatin-like phospholipase/acyl hydrolase
MPGRTLFRDPTRAMAPPIRILSLDGGGIYQMTAAMALVDLERRTGRRIAELFDFVAGTSAGALLGLACLVPDAAGNSRYTAAELLTLYEEEAGVVFKSSLWHWLKALGGLIDEKYEATGLESALAEVFGQVPLAASLRPTMIPVYDIDHDVPYFFRAHRAQADPAHAFQMRDVVRAATAAPAYFPPARIDSAAGHRLACIDGGVVAFNPALWAYLEARALWPECQDMVVASFGQTRRDHGLQYDKVLGWGRVNWISPVFELMCDAGAVATNAQVRRLLADVPEQPRYFRFDAMIDQPKVTTLDDLSSENLRKVRAASLDLVRRESAKLDRLCDRLTAA